MYCFVVVFACLALASAGPSIPTVQIEDDLASNLIDFGTAEDLLLPQFQQKNPFFANQGRDLFTTAQLTAVPSKEKVEGTIRYTVGKRVQNDHMVGYGSDTKSWTAPQDVTVSLKYPTAGVGATVTYVEIVFGQSSKLGEAKVTAGGIGQKSIEISVTARNTYYVNYVVYFYGL